jgi:hypothetical protein
MEERLSYRFPFYAAQIIIYVPPCPFRVGAGAKKMSPSASVWMGAKFKADLACQIAISAVKKWYCNLPLQLIPAASKRLFKRGIQRPGGQGSYLELISIISV